MALYTANETDAAYIIPARLGAVAAAVGIADTAGRIRFPTISIPTWTDLDIGEGFLDRPTLMPDSEIPELMRLDDRHNPLLGELWRDEVNDLEADRS